MSLIERIDEARARWNVLDHPFYLRWECGELTQAELAFTPASIGTRSRRWQTLPPRAAMVTTRRRRLHTSSCGTSSRLR